MDDHHIAVCQQPCGAGWGVYERRAGEWSDVSGGNRSLLVSIGDALDHAQQWWGATAGLGYTGGPDLTISQRQFEVLSSSPLQLPASPERADPVYHIHIMCPLGDEIHRARWARIIRYAGIERRMLGAGELNGLRVAAEVREHFTKERLAEFEAGADFARCGFRTDLWVRPGLSARALLPDAFPLPPRRTAEQAAAFAELVEKANEKKRRTAERKRTQERLAYNERPVSGGGE